MTENMADCATDCIEKPFSRGFKKFGRFVGRHPWWFFIVPIFISLILGMGLFFVWERQANNIEEQFTPVNGPAKRERRFIQDNFPQNNSVFSFQRLYTDGVYASVIAVSNTPNILTHETMREVLELDKKVREINISNGHDGYITFEGLCAKKYNRCIPNRIVDLARHYGSKIEETEFTFPFFRFGFSSIFLGYSVGGVKESGRVKDSLTVIQSAKAVRLFYFLKEGDRSTTDVWLKEFIKVFPSNLSLKSIKVSHSTSLSRQVEFEKNIRDVIPLVAVTYTIAVLFSILSCSRLDCVRNKVWVGTIGVLSAGLAVLSSFGMLLFLGVPFVLTVTNSPFLILGIGVDDMFILISCWQKTNVHDSLEDRLADTYKDAAISITITTLTDVFGFYIGLMTPFRSVWSFCLYTSTAILFCYIYSITFFGAFLVLNGRRENSNRHWLTYKPVPEVCPVGRSKWYELCCVGGAYDHNTKTEKVLPINRFFKKYYGPFLTRTGTKVCIVLLYAVYLAISIYGCCQIQEGIDPRNLAADDSYLVRHLNNEKAYFDEFGPNIMIAVTDEFPYWDQKSRSDLDACIEDFKNLSFIERNMFASWLKSYTDYGYHTNLNLSNETVFKTNLGTFLNFYTDFRQDVNFTGNSIHASRFFLQTVNVSTAIDEMNMLNTLRDTAKRCPVPLLVYHPVFIYHDQYAVIIPTTLQNTGVTTLVMFLVALLLIPNPLCSIWVSFSIASIITGVTGFMALWNVNLDVISMIILVVCVGFSVDFSAHISYAFVSCKKPSANEKAVEALYKLGYPIVQGAASSILGVVVLSASKNYIFRTCYKVIFLVMFFGFIHGLTFIPVFLTFFGVCRGTSSEGQTTEKQRPENQGALDSQPEHKPENPVDHDKPVYYNHTFISDTNQQVCQTQTPPSVWTISVDSQSDQKCMDGTTPAIAVDSQKFDGERYTTCNGTDLSVNCDHTLGCGMSGDDHTEKPQEIEVPPNNSNSVTLSSSC